MQNKTDYQVGSVIFTENGVQFCKEYTTEGFQYSEDFKEMREKALKCALSYVKGRLTHCEEELQKNIATATYISPDLVAWKNGRFTIPVHKHLVDLVKRLEEGASWEDLNERDFQQILRALYFNNACKDEWHSYESKSWAFNIASEMLMVDDE
jgi:hypothetical protein